MESSNILTRFFETSGVCYPPLFHQMNSRFCQRPDITTAAAAEHAPTLGFTAFRGMKRSPPSLTPSTAGWHSMARSTSPVKAVVFDHAKWWSRKLAWASSASFDSGRIRNGREKVVKPYSWGAISRVATVAILLTASEFECGFTGDLGVSCC
jgi:hypothetical protein